MLNDYHEPHYKFKWNGSFHIFHEKVLHDFPDIRNKEVMEYENLIEAYACLPDPREEVEKTLLKDVLNEALDTLCSREKIVLEMRFYEDKTYDEIGKRFNVTRERIRQIEAKALRKMRHPTRAKQLFWFLDNWEKIEAEYKEQERKRQIELQNEIEYEKALEERRRSYNPVFIKTVVVDRPIIDKSTWHDANTMDASLLTKYKYYKVKLACGSYLQARWDSPGWSIFQYFTPYVRGGFNRVLEVKIENT